MISTPDDEVIAKPATGRTALLGLNAAAVVIAALYFSRELLIPIVLAGLLAFVLAPACGLLQRARLPRVVAVLLVVIVAGAAIGGVGVVVGRQLASLAGNLPSYENTVMTKWHSLSTGGGLMQRLLQGTNPGKGAAAGAPSATEAASALGMENASGLSIAKTVALPLLGPLGTAGVVLVFTIFILLSNEDLRDRLVRLVGRHDLHRTILAMNDAAYRLSRYFMFQLVLNGGFGLLIGLCLWWAGLPNPMLWGILAALMRFVPFIGVFIALAPPLLLAVAVVPGWSLAIIVLALFVGCELAMGQVIEPLIYGHSTGLSPIAVIVATAFWAFLWGPIGLLLATPLTVCLVVIGRHVQPLAFFEVVLGDSPPLEPSETFYQRALEGKAMDLLPGARKQVAAGGRTEYYDTVALPGLTLAQRDLAEDKLAFERLEEIHVQIRELLEKLGGAEVTGADGRAVTPGWRDDGAILCIPGRGQLDDLAATMAVQVLRGAGFGAAIETNLILGSGGTAAPLDPGLVRMCCLSVIEEGSTASGIRYFIRRMQKTMPGAKLVVCLWHVPGDSALLADLRSTGTEEHLVLSIGELLALAQALAARNPAPAR
jgi:predicted PurR-regulated permease PerM